MLRVASIAPPFAVPMLAPTVMPLRSSTRKRGVKMSERSISKPKSARANAVASSVPAASKLIRPPAPTSVVRMPLAGSESGICATSASRSRSNGSCAVTRFSKSKSKLKSPPL